MFRILLVPALLSQVALYGADASLTSFSDLEKQARAKINATPRIPLAAEKSAEGKPTPNYQRAIAFFPNAAQPMRDLLHAVLYSGAVEPETKMAMGVRIAQVYGSVYPAVHLGRMLRATPRGRELLGGIEPGREASLAPQQLLAVRYAGQMTRNIHGVSDEEFRRVREYYNDSQLVELTLTVCFFNYFTRFVEAVNLPVERWALETPAETPSVKYTPPAARVGLISDPQMEWAGRTVAGRREGNAGRGFGVVNSQRAMFLSPEIAAAWRAYGASVREKPVLSREILLHVSFAVSMANGCRYCTLHQVQGLRRLNVDPAKLMQMKKDDSALTPRELAAVEFARKLTREPASVTDSDYAKLRAEFGEQGALEVALQTCNFAFMNRFTDGLRLPSEDEAIRVYREVYGADFEK